MVMAWRGRKGLKGWGWWWERLVARGRGGNVGISLTCPKCGRRRPNTQWVMNSWGRKQLVLLGTSGCLSSRHAPWDSPVWVELHTNWRAKDSWAPSAWVHICACVWYRLHGQDSWTPLTTRLQLKAVIWHPQLRILTPTQGSYLPSWVTPILMSEDDCSPYCWPPAQSGDPSCPFWTQCRVQSPWVEGGGERQGQTQRDRDGSGGRERAQQLRQLAALGGPGFNSQHP